jgi:hypothetical protein
VRMVEEIGISRISIPKPWMIEWIRNPIVKDQATQFFSSTFLGID